MSLLILLCGLKASAEYRVFVLKITDSRTQNTRQFESTLDPDQYRSFYLVKPTETITYIDTWKCLGNTSLERGLCDKPPKN